MSEKKQSKRELFLELAQPDDEGFSRAVETTELVGKYDRLKMGNGGDWCRRESKLAQIYNVVRNKEEGRGNKIVSVELQGF